MDVPVALLVGWPRSFIFVVTITALSLMVSFSFYLPVALKFVEGVGVETKRRSE